MATRSIRVEFPCDKKTLKFQHKVPAKLVGNIKDDPQWTESFVAVIKPIIQEHYQAAFEATAPQCCICNAPKTQVVVTPSSWLHVASDPFVHVMSMPACDKPSCDTKIRQNIQLLMSELHEEVPTKANSTAASTSKMPTEVMSCRICSTTVNTFRCARCKAAFYCGKAHQRLDWPLHKSGCKAKVEEEYV